MKQPASSKYIKFRKQTPKRSFSTEQRGLKPIPISSCFPTSKLSERKCHSTQIIMPIFDCISTIDYLTIIIMTKIMK